MRVDFEDGGVQDLIGYLDDYDDVWVVEEKRYYEENLEG